MTWRACARGAARGTAPASTCTGEVLDGPAARPLRTYPVTVEDGMVTLAVDNAVDTAAAAATDPRAARRARLAAL